MKFNVISFCGYAAMPINILFVRWLAARFENVELISHGWRKMRCDRSAEMNAAKLADWMRLLITLEMH